VPVFHHIKGAKGKRASLRLGFSLGDQGPHSCLSLAAKKQSRKDFRFIIDRKFDFFASWRLSVKS
jgi:hypothetical protein